MKCNNLALLTEKEQPLHMDPLNYLAPSNTAIVGVQIYDLVTTFDRVLLH